jgi:hypothetical protein
MFGIAFSPNFLTFLDSLSYSASDEISHVLHIIKELPPLPGLEMEQEVVCGE